MNRLFQLFCINLLLQLTDNSAAWTKLNIVTTTTDLSAITKEVAGDLALVDSIAKGSQDPHYVEAKPSFMVKANRADLLIAVGLDLEVGWVPSIIQGARNPKITKGSKGYLEVGPLVKLLEVPTGSISRADGDVHPFGNPHVTLDPIRAGEIAGYIANKLSTLDAANAATYTKNAKSLAERLKKKVESWQARIDHSKIKKVITYHKTLTYFLDRFQMENPAILEPKPGIPPTSGHIIQVINLIKSQKIPLILVENFFDSTVTQKIKQEVPSIRTETVAVFVNGSEKVKSIEDLYENLVQAIEKVK